MKKPSPTALIILAFFAIYVIWGSTYLLNKISVAKLDPFMLASIRFVTAGLLIFVIAFFSGISLKISKRQFKNTVLAGFFFLTFGNGVVVWALKYVDSGFAALEIAAQPLVVLLMMWALQGKKIRRMSLLGIFLGVIGMFLLVSQKEIVLQENALTGILMILACMLSWAYGSIFVGKAELPKNFFVNTGYQMVTGGLLLVFFSIVFGEKWVPLSQWGSDVIWAMVILIIFGSIAAFTAFNFLLKQVSPEKVSTNTYVNPIIALFLGWYFLGEKITLQSIIAALVLLTGVYFINTSRNRLGAPRTPKS
ncbi:EamA family transporter [Aegicerativicinus sediminis]|uniref:EamA family transporter n=1 Tax=Aegicerativicinus sediminis TaxID=2893202 RepID=UPI001E3911E4|nr:EamA family transporter [Aegicerativicinus sediminis]